MDAPPLVEQQQEACKPVTNQGVLEVIRAGRRLDDQLQAARVRSSSVTNWSAPREGWGALRQALPTSKLLPMTLCHLKGELELGGEAVDPAQEQRCSTSGEHPVRPLDRTNVTTPPSSTVTALALGEGVSPSSSMKNGMPSALSTMTLATAGSSSRAPSLSPLLVPALTCGLRGLQDQTSRGAQSGKLLASPPVARAWGLLSSTTSNGLTLRVAARSKPPRRPNRTSADRQARSTKGTSLLPGRAV